MKTIGIYPGNFQPAHRGHVLAYKKFRQIAGMDVFVITTDRTPIPDAPLNFGEKENIWVRHGVPASHIVKVNNWMKPIEVFSRVSTSHTNVIFALTEKEESEIKKQKRPQSDTTSVGQEHNQNDLHSAESWVNPDGSLNYFQPYKGNEHNMEPLNKHGYVVIIDDNIIDGKTVSTSNIRDGLGSEKFTEGQKKLFFKWTFGWFDIGLFQLLQDKFRGAHKTAKGSDIGKSSTDIVPQSVSESLGGLIEDVVNEFMSGMSTPQSDDLTSSDGSIPDESEKRRAATRDRQNSLQLKSQAERELKSTQADVKWKELDLKQKKTDALPNQRKKIDALNQKIAMT